MKPLGAILRRFMWRQHGMAGHLWFFILFVATTCSVCDAQSLTVLPVNIQLPFGQKATTLTVVNSGETETSIQVRAYVWDQQSGEDVLSPSSLIMVSPPLATIAPGASQIVRLVLHRSPEANEESYRILLDQIPPPAVPGVIRVVLRMSIPVFAAPRGRASSHIQFHIEEHADKAYLVAVNDGLLHESLHGLDLWTDGDVKLKSKFEDLQYLLAGATRRWLIAAEDTPLLQHAALRLTAKGLADPITQQVRVAGAP